MTQTKASQRVAPTRIRPALLVVLALAVVALESRPVMASSLRKSAVVKAVAVARPSVVNIHGQKTVRSEDQYSNEPPRRVNGMGTGVVIDGRGFILTNYHVVEGVRRIRVTMHNGHAYIARIVAHDPSTDLAIIKIPVRSRVPTIRVGTSRDLMTGETVIAVGNAYGYEHTVTTGIVSAQHRSVQVNDTQNYQDLIQTDASINPGNSGGPLLNIDGDVIGINVAVRVGAQGIGFAIPVDRAMQVAARLMNVERLSGVWHGVVAEEDLLKDQQVVVVRDVVAGSPAANAGIQRGDIIEQVGELPIRRALDLERALIGAQPGEEVRFAVQRAEDSVDAVLAVATSPLQERSIEGGTERAEDDDPWDVLGLRFRVLTQEDVRRSTSRFRGGLLVTAVDAAGLGAEQGIQMGDILVGIHVWETISMENLDYILSKSDFDKAEVEFFILRGKQTLSGKFPVAEL